MIVEMRVDHCAPTRLPALLNHFRNKTLSFFDKHGIEPIGFWTTLAGANDHSLTYLFKWDSMAQRGERWDAFQADPDWITARYDSEREQPIVVRIENSSLMPTDFSALK